MKKNSTYIVTENFRFLGRKAKIDIFQWDLALLFFEESGSTIAQIYRLGELNALKQFAV